MTINELLNYFVTLSLYDYAITYIFIYFSYYIVKDLLNLDNAVENLLKIRISQQILTLVLLLLAYSYIFLLLSKLSIWSNSFFLPIELKIVSILIVILAILLYETIRTHIRSRRLILENKDTAESQRAQKQTYGNAPTVLNIDIFNNLAIQRSKSNIVKEIDYTRTIYVLAFVNLFILVVVYKYYLVVCAGILLAYMFFKRYWIGSKISLQKHSRLDVDTAITYI